MIPSTRLNEPKPMSMAAGSKRHDQRPCVLRDLRQSIQRPDAVKNKCSYERRVPEHIDFNIAHAVSRVARARQHVMPLQDLVKDYSVEKSAQAEAEQNTCRKRE